MHLLENPLTYATTLNAFCLKTYGAKYYNWDPEVVEIELKRIVPNIPEINLDKIQAVSTLISTNQYYTYFEPFQVIINCFNSNMPGFTVMAVPTVPELCWGMYEAKLNDTEEDDLEFSPEVLGYILQLFRSEGCIRTPPILKTNNIIKSRDIMVYYYDTTHLYSGEQVKEQEELEKEINEMIKKRAESLA